MEFGFSLKSNCTLKGGFKLSGITVQHWDEQDERWLILTFHQCLVLHPFAGKTRNKR